MEAKNILKQIQDGKTSFDAQQIGDIAKHYLMLFEVLEFLHEYTPDFFVITKIQGEEKDIVCFANEEFSKTFHLKENPEGRDILDLLNPKEKEIFQSFISKEILSAKNQLCQTQKDKLEISVKSDNIELPIIHFGNHPQRLFDVHVKLIGVLEKLGSEISFDGYTIMLGRDITDIAVQQEIARSFTNIPEMMHGKFYQEAYKRRVLLEKPKTITLKNTFVCTGFSDISNSAQMRYAAALADAENHQFAKSAELNALIEGVNRFLHDKWEDAKQKVLSLHEAVFLLDETDGLDYTLCFPIQDENASSEIFQRLRREELMIMVDIAQESLACGYPLKHIIVAHSKRVDFYFEEEFENRFKPETHSVDIFIKKKRFEKACEKGTDKRVVQEGVVTVVVDNHDDRIFYQDLFQEFQSQGVFSLIEEAEVEDIPGIPQSFFIRGVL